MDLIAVLDVAPPFLGDDLSTFPLTSGTTLTLYVGYGDAMGGACGYGV